MKPIYLLLLMSLVSLTSKGSLLQPYFVSREEYQSGVELCGVESEIFAEEKGHFIEVPVDYASPLEAKTKIYFHFNNGFDAKKPSLVFFEGGPGETSHSGFIDQELPFNVILFDQRGIACSRPDSYADYRNPMFYGSERTARDAEEIRKYLKIKKWSVYGVSYGTVPATIYGHLFPESTTSVVLEGVVFSGDEELWSSSHRRKILQNVLSNLSEADLSQVLDFSQKHDLPAEWFSLLARSTLMEQDGVKKLQEILSQLDGEPGYDLADMLRQSLDSTNDDFQMPIYQSDTTVYGIISCSELGLKKSRFSPLDQLVGAQLIPGENTLSLNYCQKLEVDEVKKYTASVYPLKIPVTYFQGDEDSATESPFAVSHFINSAQGLAQLFVMPHGGHSPNMDLIMNGSVTQRKIFVAALKGKLISKNLLSELKQKDSLDWSFTFKNDDSALLSK